LVSNPVVFKDRDLPVSTPLDGVDNIEPLSGLGLATVDGEMKGASSNDPGKESGLEKLVL
jgi:hypothetical protein